MSHRGIRGFYLVLEKIEEQLLADENCNTVTTGDITEVDLNKQTIFPLAHIIINQVSQEEQVLRFNVTILTMDVVDFNKAETTDVFTGNNNEQDILNTQLGVVNKLIGVLRRGNLHQDLYQLDGNANCEPFYERFENRLAGWASTFDVLIYNDITIC
jgi:hypothetical protein|tara:strand:+ start:17511 stop:17981 length:471 start_codon:yes stop_codon:yes gene_type:complete